VKAEERDREVAANADPPSPPRRPDGEIDRLNWLVTERAGPLEDLFELALIILDFLFLQLNKEYFLYEGLKSNSKKVQGRNV
jgi:hypothetical protein